jgi:hypothetical protein
MKNLIYLVLMLFTAPLFGQETVNVINRKNNIMFNTIKEGTVVGNIIKTDTMYSARGTVEVDLMANTVFIRYSKEGEQQVIAFAIISLQNASDGLIIYGRDTEYNEVSLTIGIRKMLLATTRISKMNTLTFSTE